MWRDRDKRQTLAYVLKCKPCWSELKIVRVFSLQGKEHICIIFYTSRCETNFYIKQQILSDPCQIVYTTLPAWICLYHAAHAKLHEPSSMHWAGRMKLLAPSLLHKHACIKQVEPSRECTVHLRMPQGLCWVAEPDSIKLTQYASHNNILPSIRAKPVVICVNFTPVTF